VTPRGVRVAGITIAILAAAGLSAGLTLALRGPATGAPGSAGASYAYYESVIGPFARGSMMGGQSSGWMMGQSGYAWMMGGADAPGWMTGGSLPSSMMGEGGDPGTIMGSLFANAPGPRVSAAQATTLGQTVPAGAVADRSAHRLTFTAMNVSFTVVASPSMPQEDFEIAAMVNPTVVVPRGARVTIQFVNADTDMAHGIVITGSGTTTSSVMPMMTAAPAFNGAALWSLGEATTSGMHEGTLSFIATTSGTYQYLCPVPGHARDGVDASFVVEAG
jgi:rusticyanin